MNNKPFPSTWSRRSKPQTPSPFTSTVCSHPGDEHRRKKSSQTILYSFLGLTVPRRRYASSPCPQSSSFVSAWTCSARHTQICDAVYSSPYLPTSCCTSISLHLDLLPTNGTQRASSPHRSPRHHTPGTTPNLWSYALWINLLRLLHFLDPVLGLKVPLTSKCSGSSALEPLRRSG